MSATCDLDIDAELRDRIDLGLEPTTWELALLADLDLSAFGPASDSAEAS